MLVHPFRFDRHQCWSTLVPPLISSYIANLRSFISILESIPEHNCELEYWIFGAYNDPTAPYRWNHISPDFIPDDTSVVFHLVDPLFNTTTNRPVDYDGEDIVELIPVHSLGDIVHVYKHPKYSFRTYWAWSVAMPSYDMEGWFHLVQNITSPELKEKVSRHRPTEDDRGFITEVWSAVYRHLYSAAKTHRVIISDLVKFVHDPPHRINLPELANLCSLLESDYGNHIVVCQWSPNWQPELYRISYDIFKYRYIAHSKYQSKQVRLIAPSLKDLIGLL